jgi:hypothetical protein
MRLMKSSSRQEPAIVEKARWPDFLLGLRPTGALLSHKIGMSATLLATPSRMRHDSQIGAKNR